MSGIVKKMGIFSYFALIFSLLEGLSGKKGEFEWRDLIELHRIVY